MPRQEVAKKLSLSSYRRLKCQSVAVDGTGWVLELEASPPKSMDHSFQQDFTTIPKVR